MTLTRPDTVAILGGTGQQGRGRAQRLARAGVRVLIGSRDPERAKDTVAAWPQAATAIEVVSNAAAVAQSRIVVLAVPFASVDALLEEVATRFTADAIAIDVTVPVTFAGGKMAMLEVVEGSASEHIRARLPAAVGLAAAFKTIPAHRLGDPEAPLDCDEVVCGDSDAAPALGVALTQRP